VAACQKAAGSPLKRRVPVLAIVSFAAFAGLLIFAMCGGGGGQST